MTHSTLLWVFAAGACLHNAEEGYFAAAFASRVLREPIDPSAIRLALVVLSVCFLIVAAAAATGGPGSVGAYLVAGLALAVVVNAVVPHLVVTIATRRYAPGTATGVLLNLPSGALLIHQSLRDHDVAPAVFVYVGPAIALGVLLLALLLLVLAQAWTRRRAAGGP